ncbi:MAG: hypothetical protein GTO63_33105, partial [Anaerolineae bacterium]|nr:hypothetical protein [Anaerolineae bacterium]NIQ82358.1 hypothetical protein [Anaerolineae bacterium]
MPERAVPEGFFWDLPMGKRIECLVTLAASSSPRDLTVYVTCLNGPCGKPMETDISLQEIDELAHCSGGTDPVAIPIEGQTLFLRRPTGKDQLEFLKGVFADRREAEKAMIQMLIQRDGHT